ncbi:MAG: sodium:proton antiporter [Azospirillaceae bacterium]
MALLRLAALPRLVPVPVALVVAALLVATVLVGATSALSADAAPVAGSPAGLAPPAAADAPDTPIPAAESADGDHGAEGGDGHGGDGHGEGGHGGAPHLDGAELGLVWIVPFVGVLLSIAVMPLVLPNFWHHHFGKVVAFWAVAFLAPFAVLHGWNLALYELLHVGLLEYIPFIILLGSLFIVAGGVRVTGAPEGTPLVNTGILLIGTMIASWMGTTGAAMLLIRPLLAANENRRFKVHSVVFFIFLVANIGGSLTPLGDPPLFLGFLKGVNFFWPTVHMFGPMLLLSLALLAIYFVLDTVLYTREGGLGRSDSSTAATEKFGVEGTINVLLLGGIVGGVLLSGIWRPGISVVIYHVPVEIQNVARDLILIGMALLSLRLTRTESRRRNGFSWFPIVEVAKLFAAIFVTLIPAIAILRAGTDGALGVVVSLVGQNGRPVEPMYFWLTGFLSSFLDNALTYLVFFNTAGGDPVELMGSLQRTLLAISAGAVFFGAVTYIGNAPNFMVRSIAQERGVPMPGFFAYMGWSIVFLVPLFAVITWIFFTGPAPIP